MSLVPAFGLGVFTMITRSHTRFVARTSATGSRRRARQLSEYDQLCVKRRACQRSRPPPRSHLDKSILRADLHDRLVRASDPDYKEYISRYLRSDNVLGLRTPDILSETQAWANAHDMASREASWVKQLALILFEGASIEEKCAASMFLQIVGKRGVLGVDDLPQLAQLFDDGLLHGWAVTDAFAMRVLKDMVQRHENDVVQRIAGWCDAASLWRARAGIVGLLSIAKNKEGKKVVLRCCEVLMKRDERFAKTAVGWALREVAKYDKDSAVHFIEDFGRFLSIESVRTATRQCTAEETRRCVDIVKRAKADDLS